MVTEERGAPSNLIGFTLKPLATPFKLKEGALKPLCDVRGGYEGVRRGLPHRARDFQGHVFFFFKLIYIC
ncbi:hypothetical protein HanIR_Chr08g0365851 [Helianthus annuus]|nr:hypothetical protein HanIR_Chr08g0365851 [Helianthus annuus]